MCKLLLKRAVTHKFGTKFLLIRVDVKSNVIHGIKINIEVLQISIENQRNLLAQKIWLSGLGETRLMAETNLIVCVGINDGQGSDKYEYL